MAYPIREYGSEFDWNANDEFLLPQPGMQRAFDKAQKYRSGRDALKAIAFSCAGEYQQVLLPSLCCESMVSPFLMHGIKPVFYRMRSNYTADVADVRRKLAQGGILLYGSYFGIPVFARTELEMLRNDYPSVLLLEDCTQDVLSRQGASFEADVTVASIRKWTALPDGGLLWSKERPFPAGEISGEFAGIRREAMGKKTAYLQTGDQALKTSYRKMLAEASEILDATSAPFAMAKESEEILRQLDLRKILDRRIENVYALQNALEPAMKAGRIRMITAAPERSTLYFPILTENQENMQRQLALQGVFCPVIWPLPKEAAGVCPVAEHVADHMLALPCDHRYDREDMALIGAAVVRVCNE